MEEQVAKKPKPFGLISTISGGLFLFGLLSLIVGKLSGVCAICMFIGGIGSITFGILGLTDKNKTNKTKNLSILGLISIFISVGIAVIFCLVYIPVVLSLGYM